MPNTSSSIDLAELLNELGDISADRIVWDIEPGTATIDDMRDDAFPMCELIDGTIVRKVMGREESIFTTWLSILLGNHVFLNRLGLLYGPDALVQLFPQMARAPDIGFTSRSRYVDGKRERTAIATIIPNLMVEVLSESNRPGEMRRKRNLYFQAGVELVWQIDVRKQFVEVFTDVDTSNKLIMGDILDGGIVLPGFSVTLDKMFGTFEEL